MKITDKFQEEFDFFFPGRSLEKKISNLWQILLAIEISLLRNIIKVSVSFLKLSVIHFLYFFYTKNSACGDRIKNQKKTSIVFKYLIVSDK
jgi:hypothetical protein